MAVRTSPAESSHRKQENKDEINISVPCGWTVTAWVGVPVSHCDDSLWLLIAEISVFEKLWVCILGTRVPSVFVSS